MTERPRPEDHVVTVTVTTDEEGTYLDTVTCVCTAPPDAPCRTYPNCACEYFTEGDEPGTDQYGHPYETGRPCWLEQWFDVDCMGESTEYVGDDADELTDCGVPPVARTGHIRLVEFDECPAWEWVDHA